MVFGSIDDLYDNIIKIGFRNELSGSSKLAEEKRSLAKELEYDRRELAALREHVYNLTEEVVNDSVPLQEMKDYLNTLKILIIGGHG